MSAATIVVNGSEQPLRDGETIALLLERLELGVEPRGVAVAIDAEVVPRGQWPTRALAPGQRIEVVRAVQGG